MRRAIKNAWYWITGQYWLRTWYDQIEADNDRLKRKLGEFEAKKLAIERAQRFDQKSAIDIKFKVWARKVTEAQAPDYRVIEDTVKNCKTEIAIIERWLAIQKQTV